MATYGIELLNWKSKPNLDINNINLRGLFFRREYIPTTGCVPSFSDGQPVANNIIINVKVLG